MHQKDSRVELSATFPTKRHKYWQNVDIWLSFALLHHLVVVGCLLAPTAKPGQWGQPIP
jgi:hypothetical protein